MCLVSQRSLQVFSVDGYKLGHYLTVHHHHHHHHTVGHGLCSASRTEFHYLHFYVTFGAEPADQCHSITVPGSGGVYVISPRRPAHVHEQVPPPLSVWTRAVQWLHLWTFRPPSTLFDWCFLAHSSPQSLFLWEASLSTVCSLWPIVGFLKTSQTNLRIYSVPDSFLNRFRHSMSLHIKAMLIKVLSASCGLFPEDKSDKWAYKYQRGVATHFLFCYSVSGYDLVSHSFVCVP